MTDNATRDEFYLLKTVPAILRARGFRLYTQSGQRLVDLWLNGGAAVLGHTPPNLLRELKNTASRGLYAPLPHFTEARFLKALSKLLPGRTFRLYAAPPQELAQLFNAGKAALWRPFINEEGRIYHTPSKSTAQPCGCIKQHGVGQENSIISNDGFRPHKILIPVIPGIQSWRGRLPMGLCVAAVEAENELTNLPAGDILSPLLLAVAARGVYDIIASPQRAKTDLPQVAKVLQKSEWRREGIYLYTKEKMSESEWTTLFKKFLEAGFLLPPTQSAPLILPAEISTGEEAKLAAVLKAPTLSSPPLPS